MRFLLFLVSYNLWGFVFEGEMFLLVITSFTAGLILTGLGLDPGIGFCFAFLFPIVMGITMWLYQWKIKWQWLNAQNQSNDLGDVYNQIYSRTRFFLNLDFWKFFLKTQMVFAAIAIIGLAIHFAIRFATQT